MAKSILSEADHLRISSAVEAAERRSDGEIATMIARQSDDYRDWMLGLAALAAFLAIALVAFEPSAFRELVRLVVGDWSSGINTGRIIAAILALAVIKFIAVYLVLLWVPLRMWLTPPSLKRARVRREAIRAFRIGIESRTRARTGVLIYLSLAEHRAEIVADAAINEKVGVEEWGEAMTELVALLKQDRPADAIVSAVEYAGALIAQHFPRSADDTNEMPDRVIEL